MVNESFAKWARGFSGCDGGNPKGSIWICGIESGCDSADKLNFDADVSKPGSLTNWGPSGIKEFATYQFNSKALKLLCALAGRDVTEWKKFYDEERCFQDGSDSFKLNLYPISFKDISFAHWEPWLTKKTGFETKGEYRDWCRKHRFPILRKWVHKYCPRMIVCTSSDYEADFFKAFGDGTEEPRAVFAGAKKIRRFVTNAGRTLVAVVYVLGGPRGLKSDAELSATGHFLSRLLREVDQHALS